MMRHEQHLFAIFQKRTHERGDIRRLGDAGGLPLGLGNLLLDQRARGGGFRAVEQMQLLGHGTHQLAIHAVVPVDLLHQPPLGR